MEEKWGPGNRKNEKSFRTIGLKGGEQLELFFGEHPHSRKENSIYARTKHGDIYDFEGHQVPLKIVIQEYNYLKTSSISGDEIRKGGTAQLYLDDLLIYEEFCRSYQSGYKLIEQFIYDMEMNWDWYPHNIHSKIGQTIGYNEQLFSIDRVIVKEACLWLRTLDGKPRKKFLYEDWDEFNNEDQIFIKTSITDPALTWFPRTENKKD